jgi:hypothetical protein
VGRPVSVVGLDPGGVDAVLGLRECDSVWLPSETVAASIEHELKSFLGF